MTGRLEYQGERSDLAAAKKLFGNALILSLSAAMADVLTLAKACDVPGQDAIKLMELLDLNMHGGDARREHGARRLHAELRTGHGAQGRQA
jgi:hypothetical protein